EMHHLSVVGSALRRTRTAARSFRTSSAEQVRNRAAWRSNRPDDQDGASVSGLRFTGVRRGDEYLQIRSEFPLGEAQQIFVQVPTKGVRRVGRFHVPTSGQGHRTQQPWP